MNYDVIVIGGGPAGLAAAYEAKREGAGSVLILEREKRLGGILNQCIHDGFGVIRYNKALSGPEYATFETEKVLRENITVLTDTMVTNLTADKVVTAINRRGLHHFWAKAIVLATGCRERTRGAIAIPGSRPAGVFTAGVVQNFVNLKNIMVGKRVVILGSGDIGLIMARRLTLEGATVLAVYEMQPSSGGLQRNISQCLQDFGIPIYTGHTVTRILGKGKLTGVEVSRVNKTFQIIPGTQQEVACDTLVLSVGLIPENELANKAGVAVKTTGNGVRTDKYLQTTVPGIFSCGNCRSVMDLADYVSQQGAVAGANAAAHARGEARLIPWALEQRSEPKKGIPQPNTLICVGCPNGCQLTYQPDGSIGGAGCAQGIAYGYSERVEPMRTLTMTLKTETGTLLPVRSEQPIPKRKLLETATELRLRTLPDRAVTCGEVIAYTQGGVALLATVTTKENT